MEPTRPPPTETGPSAPTLIESLGALWVDLRVSAHDQLQLAALEAQRALLSLVWMAVYGTVVGVLVAATWLVVAGAVVLWLIDFGLGASSALMLGAALNLLGAIAFALLMRRKSEVLLFPATLRSFEPDTDSHEPASSPPAKKS
ncbi:MAG TPA: phage holin family protein [Azoarcus taiwanensis]|nr:phage holin family protein [Azoarcus taiwanensis]